MKNTMHRRRSNTSFGRLPLGFDRERTQFAAVSRLSSSIPMTWVVRLSVVDVLVDVLVSSLYVLVPARTEGEQFSAMDT